MRAFWIFKKNKRGRRRRPSIFFLTPSFSRERAKGGGAQFCSEIFFGKTVSLQNFDKIGMFKLKSKFKPAGDQPKAIQKLIEGIRKNYRHQTLMGVTGSGKTFTIANVIAEINKPTLVIAHNKTLAAQLCQEFRELFPENAVHYFVSYYDYYQPEAYIPHTDTYIDKEAMINGEIDRLRHAATAALLTREDVIIVASVSCIYGLGAPETYRENIFHFQTGDTIDRKEFVRKLIQLQFHRTNSDLKRGTFRLRGDNWEIMPPDREVIYNLSAKGGSASGGELSAGKIIIDK